MNTNRKQNIVNWHWQILSAICLSVFLFVTATFALTPPLRANGKIAFTSDRDGNREIYVMNADGSGQVRLTNNNIIDDHPTWSPDGRKIAFLSQNASGAFAIFVMNSDGTGKTQITPVNYQPPSQWFGFDEWSMSWSPDGGRIVFSEGISNADTLVIVNADGSNRRNLTSGIFPAWSPDGSKILFMRFIGSGNIFFNLYTIRPDGTDLQNITPSFPNFYTLWDSPPIWSPDGSKIAFSSTDFANSYINIANADGSNPQYFIIHICGEFVPNGCGFNTALPAWSPNGGTIAFATWSFGDRSGSEIYVKNVDEDPVIRLTNTSGSNSNPNWQPLAKTISDFDGDGRADISVFRPSDRTWYLNRSQAGFSATQFGLSTDKITPADFDGDGKTDIAVYREGNWYWLNSSNGNFNAAQFGLTGDIPFPADFTGDGQAELTVYRSGNWYTLNLANNQFQAVQFGLPTDKPVPADFDGDSRADFAVYRGGIWYLLQSTQGFAATQFGLPNDKTVPADYDGDGKTDIAVYRDGTWYLQQSSQGFAAFQFGLATDVIAPADYDGDGRADAAVFRDGIWYLRQSANGFAAVQFGFANDKPVPSAYAP
jgi:Tol biopolymer transport system component/(2Fe-2S) ferredoxin